MKLCISFLVLSAITLASCSGGNDAEQVIQDFDNDGIEDIVDTDDDNDGVVDSSDAFPLDPQEQFDTDNDGIGNNADTDDDNDGVVDDLDAFPLDNSEQYDTDNDSIGNNADTDDDNDGVVDSDDAFPLDSNETSDTDKDGLGDNADRDDDGDGVEDTLDAFPLDFNEQLDTDDDGIGNNSDTDDDNDGVLDDVDALPLNPDESEDTDSDGVGNNADFYPNDPSCHLQQGGDGETCYLTLLSANDAPLVMTSGGEKAYFLNRANNSLMKFDASTQSYTPFAELNADKQVDRLYYQSSQARVYVRYQDDILNYIDGFGNEQATGITLNSNSKIDFAQNYLIANLFEQEYSVYNQNLQLIDNITLTPRYSFSSNVVDEFGSAKWDEISESVVLVQQGTILYHLNIDDENRTVTLKSESYDRDFSLSLPNQFEFLADNKYGLFSDGSVRSLYGYYHNKQARSFTHFTLSNSLNEQGLVTVSQIEENAELNWYSTKLALLDKITLSGKPINLLRNNDSLFILLEKDGHLRFQRYQLNTDIDSDGIANNLDAFPLDKAASEDTDGDNYPDRWRQGYSVNDSITGLVLDAAPLETSCWLADHLVENNCVYQSSMDASTYGSSITFSNDGVAYIHDGKHSHLVYRYSLAEQKYLPALQINQLPDLGDSLTALLWSDKNQKLYFGHNRGLISYVESGKNSNEVYLTSKSVGIGKMYSVEDRIIADTGDLSTLNSGDITRFVAIDKNGKTTDSESFSTHGWPVTLDYVEELNSLVFQSSSFFTLNECFSLEQATGLFEACNTGMPVSVQSSLDGGNYFVGTNGVVLNSSGLKVADLFPEPELTDIELSFKIFELEEQFAAVGDFGEIRVYDANNFELVLEGQLPRNGRELTVFSNELYEFYVENGKYKFDTTSFSKLIETN